MARKYYTPSTWNEGEATTSSKLNTLNKRLDNAFQLYSDAICTLFGDNVILNKTSRGFDKVIFHDQSSGTYTDWTEEAASTQTPSFPNVTVSSLDSIYVAFDDKYTGTQAILTSPAASSTGSDWKYYNGSWTTVVSLSDATSGFTSDGIISWSVDSMTDWDKDDLNTILSITEVDGVNRYWARFTPDNGVDFRLSSLLQSETPSNELKVIATSPTSMQVYIEPGYAVIGQRLAAIDVETSITLSAPSSNSKISIIQMSIDGIISVKDGAEAATPIPPTVDNDNIKLADITIASTDISIADSAIADQRIFSDISESTYSTDHTIILTGGTRYFINLTTSGSYFVVRDPTDTIQTLWIGQDGLGPLLPAQSTVSEGDTVYYNTSNSRLEKADADSINTACIGIVSHKPTITTAILTDNNLVQGLSGLSIGSTYYLSVTAGSFSTTPPTGSGDIVQVIGKAISTSTLKVNVGEPIVLA